MPGRVLGRLLPGLRPPWEFPGRRRGERHLVLVRHAEAATGPEAGPDPGLSPRGREEAEAAAADLAHLGPLPLVVSPQCRCRETAAALEARWAATARVEPAVGELPHAGPGELGAALAGRWADLDEGRRRWRVGVLAALRALPGDTVVVTHLVAVNVVVGEATGDDRVVSFVPAPASRTFVRVGGDGRLSVVRLGATAPVT